MRQHIGFDPARPRPPRGLVLAVASLCLMIACGGGGGYGGGGGGGGGSLAPTITTQPANVSVAAGQPASFSVVASGFMPLAYQWRRGGVDISGATQSSYVLAAATAGDNGASFSVRVSNAYGAVDSSSATLTVQ
jgi:hypothetical protein